MANRAGGVRPAGVCGGVSERGLLHVHLERRPDSLSAAEGGLYLRNLTKMPIK